MAQEALKIALRNLQVFDTKQKNYGSNNISQFGELGVIIRANDKLQRLKTLVWDKAGKETDLAEPTADAWLDLANYGLIGYLCHTKIWK